MQTRSAGVTAVAALAAVSGVLSIVAGWWLMIGGSVGSTFGSSLGTAVMVFGALQFALGLVELGVGYGLWRRKPKAWAAALAVFSASIAVDVGSVLFAGADALSVVLGIVVAAVAIWYLTRERSRVSMGLDPRSAGAPEAS